MEWKILGKVLLRVFGIITVSAIAGVLFALSVEMFGAWMLLAFPILIAVYVVKMMYDTEVLRQGKKKTWW